MLNNLLHIFSNSPRLAAKRLQQGVTEGGRSSSARSRSPGRAGRAGPGRGAGPELRALSVVLKRRRPGAPAVESSARDSPALTFNYVSLAFRALKLNRRRAGEGWGIIYCLVISLFCSCWSLGES